MASILPLLQVFPVRRPQLATTAPNLWVDIIIPLLIEDIKIYGRLTLVTMLGNREESSESRVSPP